MNQIPNIEEEIRFNPRAGGKEVLTDKMIVEEVRKGDNYVVWKSPNTTVHIIPDGKLKEMFHHQELQKAREESLRKIIEVRNDPAKSTKDLIDLIDKYHSEIDQDKK